MFRITVGKVANAAVFAAAFAVLFVSQAFAVDPTAGEIVSDVGAAILDVLPLFGVLLIAGFIIGAIRRFGPALLKRMQ